MPLAARTRLLAVLGSLADDVATSALDRCPYRARDDRCTFNAGCRNQLRSRGAADLRCSGAPLNTDPAPDPNSNSNSNSNSNPNSKGGRP